MRRRCGGSVCGFLQFYKIEMQQEKSESENMTNQNKSAGSLMDAIEGWLWDNNHTSADSRIALATLSTVPSIRALQIQHSVPSHSMLAFVQQHPRRIQVGDTHTSSPWVYSIAPVQHRQRAQLQASFSPSVATAPRAYLARRLMPEDDVPNSRTSASIVLFAPAPGGGMSVLMAQSKNGKFGFIGAKSVAHEGSLFQTAERGFDEATGGVLQVIDDHGEQHLTPEVAEAVRGAQGRVILNRDANNDAALFLVPLACLPRDKAKPAFLPEQHRRMLQNPAVPKEFKRKLALAWCDLRWNDASQAVVATICGGPAALADWTLDDLQSEPFKQWFVESAGLAKAQPPVTGAGVCSSSAAWIRDYLSGARVVFQSVPGYCRSKPKQERLLACADRLERLSGIVTAVVAGCNAAGLGHSDERDKLFSTVCETCLLLQEIADELDRSDERRAFIRRCNELIDACEREKIGRTLPGATKPAIDVKAPEALNSLPPVTPTRAAFLPAFACGSQQQRHAHKKAPAFDDLDKLLASICTNGGSGKITFHAKTA